MSISYLPKSGVSLNKNISKSLSLKLIAIAALILVFLIPVSLVKGLINERQFRQSQVAGEVTASWAGAQTIAGPVMVVPYTVTVTEQNRTKEDIEYAYFLPETLRIDGKADVEVRSRGIYDVPVYTSKLNVSGRFAPPDIAPLGLNKQQMRWGEAFVVVGIPDLRGVNEQIALTWDGAQKVFQTGLTTHVVQSGVRTAAPLSVMADNVPVADHAYEYSFDLDLRGSEQLMFTGFGKTTDIKLTSAWPSPSFVGAFLPAERDVSASGFSASWRVLDINQNVPRQWRSSEGVKLDPDRYGYTGDMGNIQQPASLDNSSFGVRMFLPVDVYQKTTRSAKYGIAVIALVFVVVFFVELSAKRRVHPVQYVLIGLALVIYYTLLLSLSEHLRFLYAYLIASIAVIGMVTLFTKSVLESSARALLTGGILTVFYLFVYVLLQLEDYALLLGSIALFLILAAIMMLSRKINWYGEAVE